MNVFSIRDIEHLTGIKAHTLRIWEQRYELINPKRKTSKHRYYDNDDLKYILRIAYLYHNGLKISRIAALNEDEIRKMALEINPKANVLDIYINQLTEASIDLNQDSFEAILQNLFASVGFEKAILEAIFPLMNKIGLLWLTGNVIPAQEHFASVQITQKILLATQELPKSEFKEGRRVLVFTPEGEMHEIPLLFIQYLLKKNGVPFIYLGRNVKINTLLTYCANQPVTQLYFHQITNLFKYEPQEYVKLLSKNFPDKEIFISGVILNKLSHLPENVKALENKEAILNFVQ